MGILKKKISPGKRSASLLETEQAPAATVRVEQEHHDND
jgi:hypothetical protein